MMPARRCHTPGRGEMARSSFVGTTRLAAAFLALGALRATAYAQDDTHMEGYRGKSAIPSRRRRRSVASHGRHGRHLRRWLQRPGLDHHQGEELAGGVPRRRPLFAIQHEDERCPHAGWKSGGRCQQWRRPRRGLHGQPRYPLRQRWHFPYILGGGGAYTTRFHTNVLAAAEHQVKPGFDVGGGFNFHLCRSSMDSLRLATTASIRIASYSGRTGSPSFRSPSA